MTQGGALTMQNCEENWRNPRIFQSAKKGRPIRQISFLYPERLTASRRHSTL